MRIMEFTDMLCGICFIERLIAIVWKRELGEPTFEAFVCRKCDDVFLEARA